MNSKTPIPIRIALAIGGAAVAGWLGGYAVLSWYRASKDEREELMRDWVDVFLGGE
jgi:hypothetical protein